MWSAIKSDLLDFVTTIQEDTSKTLSLVLGDEEVDAEAEEENMLKKWVADAKRSYETYANPLKERRAKEFERYKKRFTLTTHTKEIADILDEEPEVSRFYAELVPAKITPDEFWARLFFRLQLLTRTGNVNFEEDDEEEELTWEEAEIVADNGGDQYGSDKVSFSGGNAASLSASISSSSLLNSGSSNQLPVEERAQFQRKITGLEEENQKLRGILSSLTNRIAQLELDMKTKTALIQQLQSELDKKKDDEDKEGPILSTQTASISGGGVGLVDNWSDASSENMSLVNHSDMNSSTPYGTDEETSRHGVGGKATLIMTSPASKTSSTVGDGAASVSNTAGVSSSACAEDNSSQLSASASKSIGSKFVDDELDEEEDGWN